MEWLALAIAETWQSFNADTLEDATLLYDRPAVYFLFCRGELVYIGQSCDPAMRVLSHRADKEFDRVLVLPAARKVLLEIEARMILHFRPRLNRQVLTESGVAVLESHIENRRSVRDRKRRHAHVA